MVAQQQRTTVDAVVLGGGWAGLTAALRLVESDKIVTLIEARPRLGGRAFTHTYDESSLGSPDRTVVGKDATDAGVTAIDFGCSWVHGYAEGNPVREICKDLGIAVTPAQEGQSQIIGPHGCLSPELTAHLKRNLQAASASAAVIARESKDLPHYSASLASHLFSRDGPLFEGLQSESEKELARDYARMLHIPLGTTLEQVALRWTKFEQSFAGTDAAPEGGFSRVIAALAKTFAEKGGSIRLAEKVRKVKEGPEGITVTTEDSQGTTRELISRVGLITFPLATLKNTSSDMFEPALSQRKTEVIKRVKVGDLNKVLLVYSAPWWDVKVISFTILPSHSSETEGSNLGAILSSSTIQVSAGSSTLLAMIGADAGAAIEQFPKEQVMEALHILLSQRLQTGATAATHPVHHFMSRWSSHEFTGGATTTPLVTGEHSSPLDFVELGRPEFAGRLGFAGEHTDMHHRGSIAGAVLSGQREARRLTTLLEQDRSTSIG